MFNAESLQKKWAPVLNHDGLPEIKDSYRKSVTAILLENQEKALREERAVLTEAPTNVGPINTQTTGAGAVDGFDPILISLIRRAMPKLIAYDIAGVQPMSGPTGLIFAMRSHYVSQTGNEAFFNEPDAQFSGTKGTTPPTATTEKNPGLINDATGGGTTSTDYDLASSKFTTSEQEALGDGTSSNNFQEMAFSIDRIAVEAKGRALRADYSVELAQDLKAIHGLDAESELANILSTEILAEINREVVRTVYRGAKPGAQANVANAGVFDLDVDSNGRWSVEKFKGLMFQIERDANAIANETRRGKGNIIITSSDVASALAMSGVLDYDSGISGAVGGIGEVDDTGNTFVGTLNGRFKVYIDPYSANVSSDQYYVVGYKGTNAYDAGLFYCPYVPLQMYRAIGQDSFQPRIGFKTRYGMVLNPFAKGLTALSDSDPQAAGNLNANAYYRRVLVSNLM
jgi:hypothetical protein